MEKIVHFLMSNGYWVVFLSVFLERVGPPIPALFVLIGMGALVAEGLALIPGIPVALLACVLGDLVWFELGRHHGPRILGLMCKLATEPDSCVRKTTTAFGRHGAPALLLSKFLPPFSFVVPPLAGQLGMSRFRFLIYDAGSSLVWIGFFTAAAAFQILSRLLRGPREGTRNLKAALGTAKAKPETEQARHLGPVVDQPDPVASSNATISGGSPIARPVS